MNKAEYEEIIYDLDKIWRELFYIAIDFMEVPKYIEGHSQIIRAMNNVRDISNKYGARYYHEVYKESEQNNELHSK